MRYLAVAVVIATLSPSSCVYASVYRSADLLVICAALYGHHCTACMVHDLQWLAPLCRVIWSVFRPEFIGILSDVGFVRHNFSTCFSTLHSEFRSIYIWILFVMSIKWFYMQLCSVLFYFHFCDDLLGCFLLIQLFDSHKSIDLPFTFRF